MYIKPRGLCQADYAKQTMTSRLCQADCADSELITSVQDSFLMMDFGKTGNKYLKNAQGQKGT